MAVHMQWEGADSVLTCFMAISDARKLSNQLLSISRSQKRAHRVDEQWATSLSDRLKAVMMLEV